MFSSYRLLDDCRNCTSAYCVTTLTDSELKTLLHSDRCDERKDDSPKNPHRIIQTEQEKRDRDKRHNQAIRRLLDLEPFGFHHSAEQKRRSERQEKNGGELQKIEYQFSVLLFENKEDGAAPPSGLLPAYQPA